MTGQPFLGSPPGCQLQTISPRKQFSKGDVICRDEMVIMVERNCSERGLLPPAGVGEGCHVKCWRPGRGPRDISERQAAESMTPALQPSVPSVGSSATLKSGIFSHIIPRLCNNQIAGHQDRQ